MKHFFCSGVALVMLSSFLYSMDSEVKRGRQPVPKPPISISVNSESSLNGEIVADALKMHYEENKMLWNKTLSADVFNKVIEEIKQCKLSDQEVKTCLMKISTFPLVYIIGDRVVVFGSE